MALALMLLIIVAPVSVVGQPTTNDESCEWSLLQQVAGVVRNELKHVNTACGASTPLPLTSVDRETAISALRSWSSRFVSFYLPAPPIHDS